MPTPLRPLIPRAARFPRLPLDGYFTDGRRLLRVVEASAESAFTLLEDCLTLDVRQYSPGELAKMRLRPVGLTAQS
ncbi:MAG TPA: hypothetical protein VED41_01815 [Solirubrobacteraceae bacterium]|nr:hypothetical protein [Solirubrobacteraceae bacterium]